MAEHCKDNAKDRQTGAYWERQFCVMARDHGYMFTPMQIGRTSSAVAYKGKGWNAFTLPDITIWTYPGQHHEIKHKNATRGGLYGLEEYRLNALLSFANETRQDVYYTIHDHDKAGGRNVRTNRIEDWVTANVRDIDQKWTISGRGLSYVNGQKHEVEIRYWPTSLWEPLQEVWLAIGLYEDIPF